MGYLWSEKDKYVRNGEGNRNWLFTRFLATIIFLKMRTQPVYLFEARQDDNTVPVEYTQPQSLHRQYQKIAQSHQVQSDAKVKQLLQSFQACPFLDIRSLMTSFVFSKMKRYHDEISNILQEQYMVLPQARNMDEQYQRVLDQLRHEEMCYTRLIEVVEKYNKEVRDVGEGMGHCVNRWNAMRNEEIIRDFQNKWQEYKAVNKLFKNSETSYFQLKSYREWIIKAANEIFRRAQIQNYPISDMQEMEQKLNQLLTKLQEKIEQIERQKYNLRNKVKYGKVAPADFVKVDVSAAAFYYNTAFGMLHNVGNATAQDASKLRKAYQNLRDSYKKYLRQYKIYEHINMLTRLEPEYERIVTAEQEKLTSHLKKHHQLMVPYEPSDSFNQVMENLKDSYYEPQLYINQLLDLQQAILFLNKTYPRLFKEVCQGKGSGSVTMEISNNVKNLRNGLPQGYNTILEQSLARLQQLNTKK